jgi:ATP-dependent DNA helicase RecQ
VKKENLQVNLINLLKQKAHAENRLEEMINYAFAKECRFRVILKYFGEDAVSYKCGKCDICMNSEEDHSINDFIENKILDLIGESGTGFTAAEIISILHGKSEDAEHMTYNSYSSCTHFSSIQIKDCIKELEQVGRIIKNDLGKYVLFEPELNLELDSTKIESNFEPYLKLFNTLRQIRRDISNKFNQSPNLVCPDEVLKAIAEIKPMNTSALLSIKGFSQRMYNKIGEEILTAVRENATESKEDNILDKNKVPDNIKQIFDLVKKRYSLKDISSLTKLPEAVVSMQIESLINLFPDLIIDSLVEHKKAAKIRDVIQSGVTDIKELKNNLGNEVTYAEIRIILAKEARSSLERF